MYHISRLFPSSISLTSSAGRLWNDDPNLYTLDVAHHDGDPIQRYQCTHIASDIAPLMNTGSIFGFILASLTPARSEARLLAPPGGATVQHVVVGLYMRNGEYRSATPRAFYDARLKRGLLALGSIALSVALAVVGPSWLCAISAVVSVLMVQHSAAIPLSPFGKGQCFGSSKKIDAYERAAYDRSNANKGAGNSGARLVPNASAQDSQNVRGPPK